MLQILQGVQATLVLSAIAFLGGGIAGLGIALARTSKLNWLRRIAAAYIDFFQGLTSPYTGTDIPRPVDQTFEILYDNFQAGDTTTAFSGGGFRVFRVSPTDSTTALENPTAAAQNGTW